jgi:hypothetical protein
MSLQRQWFPTREVWITGTASGEQGSICVPWYHFRADCGGLRRIDRLASKRSTRLEPTQENVLRFYRPCPACALTTAIWDICSQELAPDAQKELVFATGFFGGWNWLEVAADDELARKAQVTYATVVTNLIAELLDLHTVATLVSGVVFSGIAPQKVVEDLNTVVTARWFSSVHEPPSDDQISLFWTLAIDGVQRGSLTHDVEELLFESAGLMGMAA